MTQPPNPSLLVSLLEQHGPALALYARQWTDDPDSCVQEALVELARLPQPPDSPPAWLYRVVKRRALNMARGDRRRRERELESFRLREAEAPQPSQENDRVAIAELLEQLDSSMREAIVLRLWGGLTYVEAAKTMGVSTATAQRIYQQAIAQIRELWNEPCPTKN